MAKETNTKSVDLNEDTLLFVGWGFVYRCVCTPKSWAPERVSDEATRHDPPGIALNRWEVSEPHEREGEFNNTNQIPCPEDPNRVHWLINC